MRLFSLKPKSSCSLIRVATTKIRGAATLKSSVNTIKSRYYRALDRLRLSMRTLSHDGDPQ